MAMLRTYHAVFLLLLQLSQLVSTAVTEPFTFTCDMDGNVEITITGSTYNRFSVQNTEPQKDISELVGDTHCNQQLQDISGGKISLTKCNRSKPIYLHLMNTPDATGDAKVAGGKDYHEYVLQCMLAVKGKLDNVNAGFKPSAFPVTDSPKTVQPTLNLKMTLTPNKVVIGQAITVTIAEGSGSARLADEHHYIYPQSCEATPRGIQTPKVVIFSGQGKDSEFFDADFAINEYSSTATLRAFEFVTATRSAIADVSVSCSVKVCPSKQCIATTTTMSTTSSTTAKAGDRRRRSDEDTLDKKDEIHSVTHPTSRTTFMKDVGTIHEITGTFQIVSSSENSSSAGDRKDAPRLLLLLVMFAASILHQIFG